MISNFVFEQFINQNLKAMNIKRTFAFVAMCCCAFAMHAQNLTSPDGNLKMNFSLNSNGAPVYELFFKPQIRN